VGDVSELLDVFELEPAGEGHFVAQNATVMGGSVVFGGQILAQSIVAGATVDPAKEVKTIHTIFARGAARLHHVDVDVER
jgi:acyl-CoA thioesterase